MKYFNIFIINKFFLIKSIIFHKIIILHGDWGLGIGDWGLGIGDWAQSPIPNPQKYNNIIKFILINKNLNNY